ncbi:MAG: hypothetical protein NT031_00755 [Planctomycetota bacterium]|nr:hypothetical protein [Planctomycetota bacterium]
MPAESTSRPAVVLVADRTLSANYRVLLEGMFATMQTTTAPAFLMRRLLAPKVRVDSAGRAATAPIALRRIESALLAGAGLAPRDVVVTTPEALASLLGPWVKVVGVSSSDPLGCGMSNTTTSSFWQGELYTRLWTRTMMQQLVGAKSRFGFRVLAGGAGAWQWLAHPDEAAAQGVDTVFQGWFEDAGPAAFANALAGQALPQAIHSHRTAVENIRPIRGLSSMGLIELSRGCGKACQFCLSGSTPMAHLPVETIVADLAFNVAGGMTTAVAGCEDFFRYGSTGANVNFDALHKLLTAMHAVEGVSFIQLDHANISSVSQLTDEQLRETRRLLTRPRTGEYLWLNMGIESGSGALVAANAPGKLGSCRPEDWGDLVEQTAERMRTAGFFPVFSLILGLPGETPADVAATLALVRRLAQQPVVIFQIFHEPFRAGAGEPFAVPDMRADHLELYTTCYELNFRNVPAMFADNQRAGGVSWCKRTLVQLLGRGEIHAWRKNFQQIAQRQSP